MGFSLVTDFTRSVFWLKLRPCLIFRRDASTGVTNISSPKILHVKLSGIVDFLTCSFSILSSGFMAGKWKHDENGSMLGELPLYFEVFIYKLKLGKPITTTCLCRFLFAVGSSITLQYQIIASKMAMNVSFYAEFQHSTI